MCFAAWSHVGAAADGPPDFDPHQLDVEHELSLEFETPHTKWARPYARGKLRVLFVCGIQQGGTTSRELIELMQRADLEAEAAYYWKPSSRLLGDGNPRWYGDPQAGTNRILRLLSRPFDLFFFNSVSPQELPPEVARAVLDAVGRGTGLVMTGAAPDDALLADARPADVPSGLQGARCLVWKKSRIALLPLREQVPYEVGWENRFDHQMQSQVKALLWAADLMPMAELSIRPAVSAIERPHLPASPLSIHVDRCPDGARLQVVLCREDGVKRTLIEQACPSPQAALPVELPRLRAGSYHLDALLTSQRGVETWDSVSFQVTSERTIAALELDQEWGEVGGAIAGSVRLTGRPEDGERVSVRLIDRFGRILANQQPDDSDQAKLRFRFPIEPWMPMLVRVQAVLSSAGEEVSAAHTFFNVTHRHYDQFHFVMWNYPGGDLGPYGVDSMRQHGVTAYLQSGNPPRFLAEYGMVYVPYTTRICPSSHSVAGMLDDDGLLLGGCFNDHESMDRTIREVVERYRDSRGHGVLAYSLGDENTVRAACLSPHCLEAYRAYLERVYGTIDALNAEWETDFTRFDQVTLSGGIDQPAPDAPQWFKTYFDELLEKHRTDSEPLSESQIRLGLINDEIAALEQENFARWYDRQAFQNENLVDLCVRYAQAFKALDPQARTGFEGTDCFSIRRHTTRTRQGGDVDRLVRDLDYFIPYHGTGNELVRSLVPPGYPCGNWMGYRKDADSLLDAYWSQVTNGMNTVQWWRWDCLEEYHGFLSQNLAPYPATRELLEDTRVVRDGLGTLLMKSTMYDDQVAMLYSLPSTYLAHVDDNPSFGSYELTHRRWHELIHACGLQFRYVTDRMLRLGEFDESRYRVLILPLALAVGEAEAEAIRRFVYQGGTVIADVRPGVYSGHGKLLETGLLDDLFGIERGGRKQGVLIDRMAISGEVGGQPVAMQWGNWFGMEVYPQMTVDPAVKATTGTPLGKSFYYHYWNAGAPAGIVRQFGQGRAVLLNFSVLEAPARELIQQLLGSAGVESSIRLETPDGAAVHDVEVTRWQNGEMQIISLFGDYDGELFVTLPDERFVCDLKHPRTARSMRTFPVRVRPHRAEFFAVLPAPPSPAEIAPEAQSLPAGSVLQARVRVPGAAGLHVLGLRAVDPHGADAEWLDDVVIAGNDAVPVTFPFAFNDPPGTWTLSVTDRMTGRTTTTHVELTDAGERLAPIAAPD